MDGAIAVIGVGCRFPDAWSPHEFWQNIATGQVAIRDLDPDRLRAAGLSEELLASPEYVKRAAGIPGAAEFAADFFGYSPSEAEATDPQQRIFLEACWQALESAGRPPIGDSLVTGVFAGGSPSTYLAALQTSRALAGGVIAAVDDVALHLGGLGDFLPSRVAYKLGLRGPSIGVQTACSSSLTAVHYAVLSLLSGECDMALAGGASVNEPMLGYRHQVGALSSKDGYCRPFDARSTGTSFSSGVGVVVLRRLADAQRDGDPVLAVVRGTAVGNDGSNRSGFTAPSPAGLADVVAAALDVAGVRGDQLRYVEAHGSGTPLGDQIELRGLTAGLRAGSGPALTGYCGLGSVKANIGHCGPAAGIAGLIKAIQVARTGRLPPHPLFERPRNPGVLAESPFTISRDAGAAADGAPYTLVNSMGLGGTNATAVIGPPPAPTRAPAPEREQARLVLSARDEAELDAVARNLADALEQDPALPVADVAHTLRVGRTGQAHRRVVTVRPADDRALLADALRAPAEPAPKALRRVQLVVSAPAAVARPVLTRLHTAFGGRAEVVTVTGDELTVPAGRFTILIGPGVDRHAGHQALEGTEIDHVLPLEDPDGNPADPADPGGPDCGNPGSRPLLADRLDAAVTAAWLHGIEVDWAALADGRGQRLALPTYPFTRGRYWALDHLPPPAAPPARTAETAPAAVATPGDEAPGDEAPGDEAPDEGDSVLRALLELWRQIFGRTDLGPDEQFGELGGDSLTAMRVEAGVQRQFGVAVNVYRVGGAQATARRTAEIVRGLTSAPDTAEATAARPCAAPAPAPATEADLVDADLRLPLGEVHPNTGIGTGATAAGDTLLTSATGFLDTFVLHELLRSGEGRVHCVLPVAGEAEGRELLRARAEACALPAPDPARVPLLLAGPAGLAGLFAGPAAAQLPAGVGRVVHTSAPFGLTGPYEELRDDTVLPFAALLTWMRGHGIEDITLLSTLSACGAGLGAESRVEETREQPLRPGMHGGAVAAWVGERLLGRAEQDGMRVRVFRTGLLLGSAASGACDPDHPLWRLLAGALAVGAHPRDERPLAVSPVDLAARAIAELALSPVSEGRAYHLVGEDTVTAQRLFELLAAADRPTSTVTERQWQRDIALRALDHENETLDPLAPRAMGRFALGATRIEAKAWQSWLSSGGHDPRPTGELLLRSLDFAARRRGGYAELLGHVALREDAPQGTLSTQGTR
ncbi:polyketide synthase type I [Streptomyces sp. BA2]|nr:polyketide synthase type I [Streptomyces sp. BA2]